MIALYPRKIFADDAGVENKAAAFSDVTLSYNAKNKTEVDDVLKEVEKCEATIVEPYQKVFWGWHSGYFKDLNPRLIAVVFNFFWQLDEKNLILPN